MNRNKEQNIKIKREPYQNLRADELTWENAERQEIESRILALRNDQIGALASILVGFSEKDLYEVVQEIRESGVGAIHLATILSEAKSKEKLLWWLDYFEKENKNQLK